MVGVSPVVSCARSSAEKSLLCLRYCHGTSLWPSISGNAFQDLPHLDKAGIVFSTADEVTRFMAAKAKLTAMVLMLTPELWQRDHRPARPTHTHDHATRKPA